MYFARTTAALASAILLTTTAAMRAQDPASDARFLQPLLDAQALAVAAVEIDKVDFKSVAAEVRRISGDGEVLTDVESHVVETLKKLSEAGVSHTYLIFSMADMPNSQPLVVFRLKTGVDADKARSTIANLKSHGGPTFPADRIVQKGDALVVGSEAAIKRLENSGNAARPELEAALAATAKSPGRLLLIPTGDVRRVLSELFPNLPAPFGEGAGKLLGKSLQWAAIEVNITEGKLALRGTWKTLDAASAAELKNMMAVGLQALPAILAETPDGARIGGIFAKMTPRIEGDRVVVVLGDTTSGDAASGLASLFGAARVNAVRSQSMNSLKHIALSLHNYHDAYKGFPASAILSKDGKPLLSWRVAVLPYLDQEALYKQFKLDEPWDSEHNRPLIAKMPAVYKLPLSKVAKQGKTCYLGVGGPSGIISAKSVHIREIRDGTSQTIMTVEVDDDHAVIWTKPGDLEVAEGKTIEGLGGHFANVFLAGFGDGSVQALEMNMPAEKLRAFMTKSGGEVIER